MISPDGRLSFYQDASHHYLILSCGDTNTDHYQYRMLAANQIPGILPCNIRYIEASCCIYYDISGKQSLEECAGAGKLSEDLCFCLIRELIQTEKRLSEYLLDSSGLLLNPSCIYEDPQSGNWFFMYSPMDRSDMGDDMSLNGLAEFLALQIDMTCSEEAAMVLRLCTLSANPNYILDESVFENEAWEPQEMHGENKGYSTEHVNSKDAGKTESCESDAAAARGEKSEFDTGWGQMLNDSADTDDSQPSDDKNTSGTIEPGAEITLAVILCGLSVFIGWFGNIMRLRNQERILDFAAAGTMAVCGVYFLLKHLVRWIRSKKKS